MKTTRNDDSHVRPNVPCRRLITFGRDYRLIPSLVLVCAAAVFLLVGCALPGCTATGGFLGTGIGATSQPTTPTVQLANLEDLYALTVNGVVALRKAGTIKPGSQADKDFLLANTAAYAALVNMRVSVAAGLGIQQTDLNAFEAALVAVAAAKSNGSNAATTNP